MRSRYLTLLASIMVCLSWIGCTEDMEYKDAKVSQVTDIYSPNDNVAVELVASATASLYFEWSPSLTQDQASPLYEVLFTTEDGSFDKPVYRALSDDGGLQPHATITHKQLDKVCSLAGVESGEVANLKWTVNSCKGLNEARAAAVHHLTITRLNAFENIPNALYIYGAGAEGADAAAAQAFTSSEQDVFEIYTKLEAGKDIYMTNATTGDRTFTVEGSNIKEKDNAFQVAETAVYKMTVDFTISTVIMTKVTSLGLYFCPSGEVTLPLEYAGNGVWSGKGTIEFKQESWGRDERYKFEMVKVGADGGDKTTHWGPTNSSLDSRPGDDEAPAYFFVKEYGVSQWDQKWKFHGDFDGKDVVVTFSMNADGPYTHAIVLDDNSGDDGDDDDDDNTGGDNQLNITDLYLTGEGTENGTDISNALAFTKLDDNTFELFTELEASKTISFANGNTSGADKYVSENDALVGNGDGMTIDDAGVYRIRYNKADNTVSMDKVESFGYYFCPNGAIEVEMDYQGNGVWSGEGMVTFKQESWGKDQRYKFQMTLGGSTIQQFGALNATDVAPSDSEAADYYYMKSVSQDQWNDKWKLQDKFDGQNTRFTVTMNAAGTYTHSIELVD